MKKNPKWLIPFIIVILLSALFLIYTGNYYHADESALAALESDENVRVSQTAYGWLFDGPSEKNALIFYPGAKVEETAYAPMLHLLAAGGMDVCLVNMPFHLACFGVNKAAGVISTYDYDHWYIGGHSLGGTIAAYYAADHGEQLTGLILLASYPLKTLDSSLTEISIYGSEDGVLNLRRAESAKAYAPDNYLEYVIEGGNHAQFGNYGAQNGDGKAAISPREQQSLAVDFIIRNAQSESL